MNKSSDSGVISPGSPINGIQPQMPLSQQAPIGSPPTTSLNEVPPQSAYQTASGHSPFTPELLSEAPRSPSAVVTVPSGKPKSKVKAPNVFTNDGSFLDRIRRSMKEEEDRRKEKDIQARKIHFADRFKSRGKRQMSPGATTPGGHSTSDVTPESEADPTPKKRKLSISDRRSTGDSNGDGQMTAQEEYHNAMESYPTSLKDGGTGVRPLIK